MHAEFYILDWLKYWRNMNISSIFYFSKLTSINTQYSSVWDTLKMMLFTKYLKKWKRFVRISWKFQSWFNSNFSIENICYTCLIHNAPLIPTSFLCCCYFSDCESMWLSYLTCLQLIWYDFWKKFICRPRGATQV